MTSQAMSAATEAMLIEHMNTMQSIQQKGLERFISIANVQTKAIDRVLTDESQRLGHLIVPDAPLTEAQEAVTKPDSPESTT